MLGLVPKVNYILSFCFLDQELIPCRCSSYCCTSCQGDTDAVQKSPRLSRFIPDHDEIWQDSNKYATIEPNAHDVCPLLADAFAAASPAACCL